MATLADDPEITASRFHASMELTATGIRRETTRRLRRMRVQIGEEVRRMRLDAHLSIAELSRATEVDAGYLWRIEAGQANASGEVLTAIGVALEADLSIRYFSGTGPRVHDRFQGPIIEALIRTIDPRWRIELEVPIVRPARGVIDAVLHATDKPLLIATEVHSDLHRVEQQLRWSREKAVGLAAMFADPDGTTPPRVSRLLVLRSTVRMRQLARQYRSTFEVAYPARTADVVDALTTPDAPWPGDGIAWIHLHGLNATLMRHPPNGVAVGR